MKNINSVFIALLFCITTNAQSGLPLTIESPKMDSYLQDRQPATLSIQINNAPDSVKKVDVKCTFVSFGANFQITKYYATNSKGSVKITLDQNLPYQQIWLSVGDYLYAGVYVNTDLKITVDVSKIKSKDGVPFFGNGISYSGIDGELNTVMNKHTIFRQAKESKLTNNLNELCRSRKNYISDLFFKKTDSIWQALSELNNEFIHQYPKYSWAINNEAASEFYGMLCTSYWGDTIPQNLLIKINNHQPYFTSNDGVLFYNYLNTYFNARVPSIENNLNKIDSIYHSPKADVLKTFLLAKGKNSYALTYPEILKSMKTGWCKSLVSNELKETIIKQNEIDSLLTSAMKLNSTGNFIGTPIEQLPFNARLYKLVIGNEQCTRMVNNNVQFR